jgi:uncharacterized membrane protein
MSTAADAARQYSLSEVLGAGGSEVIADAVHEAELRTSGEIVVRLVQALPPGALPRDAAIAEFQRAGISKTRQRNGILVYVALLERKIELVADEGIAAVIQQDQWNFVVQIISLGFRAGYPAESIAMAVTAMGDPLALHFPWREGDTNELPDAPL